ncbi:MAG TPA: hypothetical protein VKB62_06190 [Streptosporangiaceae bacterium]|nr:hypothetical protein [Streptosporangiaceae bacterium]
MKLISRRAAIILAGSALALAGNILPADAATTGWRVEAKVAIRGSENVLFSVAAVSPSDAWAAGFSAKGTGSPPQRTVIRHWTGKTWRPVTLPAPIATALAKRGSIDAQLGVASARNVWFFGGIQGGYLRLNGGRWRLGWLPGGGPKAAKFVDIHAVKAFSSTDVWAFGERDTLSATQVTATPYAAHFNGRKWVRVTVPRPASGSTAITAVGAVSSGDIWAVESKPTFLGVSTSTATLPKVLHWTASTGWQVAAQQPPLRAADQLTSAAVEPNGDVWFGGSAKNRARGTTPLAAAWNGTSWSVKVLPVRATSTVWQLDAMTPDGAGGIWALARVGIGVKERIWHLRGATWSLVSPAFGKHLWVLEGLALVPRTQSVWAVGGVQVGKLGADGLIAIDGPLPRRPAPSRPNSQLTKQSRLDK